MLVSTCLLTPSWLKSSVLTTYILSHKYQQRQLHNHLRCDCLSTVTNLVSLFKCYANNLACRCRTFRLKKQELRKSEPFSNKCFISTQCFRRLRFLPSVAWLASIAIRDSGYALLIINATPFIGFVLQS